MEVVIEIRRQEDAESSPYFQSIKLTLEKENLTVASLLREINADSDIRDIEGKKVSYIGWECSCLQKKCGACAMLVNGKPKLACDTFLRDYERIILKKKQALPIKTRIRHMRLQGALCAAVALKSVQTFMWEETSTEQRLLCRQQGCSLPSGKAGQKN